MVFMMADKDEKKNATWEIKDYIRLKRVGIIGTVGKISAFWQQSPRFNLPIGQDLN